MRAFWTLIAVLTAFGVWFAFVPGRDGIRPELRDGLTSAAIGEPESPRLPNTETATATPDPAGDRLGDTLMAGLLGQPTDMVRGAPTATDTRSPAEITRRIDARTLELDGRFRVIGTGSADDPYRISWDILTSAAPFIDPTQALLTPPPWVRALDGSHVEITAYYSTALRLSVTRNVLLTLNRWDGCCIGLPPTPFDAIDVTLAAPVDLKGTHLFRFGTFRGRLVVEPFAVGAYLLGLYRLEDATFIAQ